MFKPVSMVRLKAVVLERDERAALRGLGELGALHLVRTLAGPATAPLAAPDRAVELARCDRLLARVAELRRTLDLTATTTAPAVITLPHAEEIVQAFETRVAALGQRRQQLRHRWSEATITCERLTGYCGLDLPLHEPAFLHFVIGSLPTENFEQLEEVTDKDVLLVPLAEQHGRQSLIALTGRQPWPVLENALHCAGFRRETLPSTGSATVDSWVDEQRREVDRLGTELAQVNDELRVLAVSVAPALAEVEWVAGLERRLCAAEQNFPRTAAAVLVTGWVPAAAAAALAQRLRDTTGGRCAVVVTEPDDVTEDEIPVLLRQPRLFRPFANLVVGYGLPQYREVSPTFFVAVSYLLMFGMMFGDVGHGLVLAIGGLALLLAGRTASVRDGGLLVMCAGVVSAVFGVVYGSCFGLAWFKPYALWRDPLEGSPLELLQVALGVGVGMISLGLVLNIINRFRRQDALAGLLDKFGVAGLVFYWGAVLWVTGYVRGVAWLVLPVLAWVLKEPVARVVRRSAGESGWLPLLVESAVEAFEALLVYLANTISFVRLAAYAMSHAALLLAAWLLAAEVQRMSPANGWLSVLVIIAGNAVAIGLEGIIAAVQALRLEYYEFFNKFFSGTGRPFEPFRLVARGADQL